jgi:hypothetical protein
VKYIVTAAVQGFTGRRAGVHFVGGSVTLDDEIPAEARALAHFLRREYTVEPVDLGELIDEEIAAGALSVVSVTDQTPAEPGSVERPKDNGSTADWLAYARSLGFAAEDPEEEPTRAELQSWVRTREAADAPVDSDKSEDSE